MDYVNKNTHDAYVKDNDGKLKRLLPGQVIEDADGAFADGLAACPGIESASSADKKAWASSNSGESAADTSPTPSSQVNDAITQARAAASALLAATNQLVIGDDQAPYGPPSGTVTTVQAVPDKEHFGPLSAAHVGAVPDAETAEGSIGGLAQPSGAEVHNSQVEATKEVAGVSEALAALHGEPDSDEPDDDGDDLESLTGDQIDAELKDRDLPVTGKVEERRERLRDALDAEDASGDDSDDGDDLESLTGDQIDAELKDRDLPVTGKVAERRERLRDALDAENASGDGSGD